MLLASLAALAALLVVACSSTPTTAPPTEQAAATEGPVGTGPTPKPTAWPGDVVSAMIALGAADASFQSMGNDLQTAVDSGNLQELLQVTNDSLTFLKGISQNVPHLQGYDSTKPLGDALAAAFQQMTEGMQKIHDSLQNGDASGVTAGFQEFVAGNTAYGAQRQTLSDMSQEAIFMQRIYLR